MENLCFSRKILNNYNLKNKHLFKKSAGNAKYYYQIKYDDTLDNDLMQISKLYKDNIPFKIFGMHTNLYITEKGYNGFFIDISQKENYIKFDELNEEFIVSGNTLTSAVVNHGMNLGYDFASLTGIPGMVGASVVGNASWIPTGKDYGMYVKKITVFDFENSKYVEIIPDKNFFLTRNSFIKEQNRIKTKYFVKEVVLKTEYIGKDAVREKYERQIEQKRESLKVGYAEGCAGSIWSNIDLKNKIGKSFRIILKETTEFDVNFNGARYSKNGARFFTTDEDTTDKDVAKLFEFTINKLQELYQIKPVKEVVILDEDGEIDVDTFIKKYR